MSKQLIIGVDVDGVIADLHTEWLRRYNRDFDDNKTTGDIKHWDLSIDIKPEAHKKIFEYLLDSDLYEHVSEMPGAKDGIRELVSDGHRIVYVTSCVPGMADQKLIWLSEHGFLPESTRPQKNFIAAHDKSLITTDFLIDDRFENVNTFRGKGILYTQPYNVGCHFFYRVWNWTDIPVVINYIARHMEVDPILYPSHVTPDNYQYGTS